MHPLRSVGGRMAADKMRVVQIGHLTHDLHLSIFPSLLSDRRSEPIINLLLIWHTCTIDSITSVSWRAATTKAALRVNAFGSIATTSVIDFALVDICIITFISESLSHLR